MAGTKCNGVKVACYDPEWQVSRREEVKTGIHLIRYLIRFMVTSRV